MAWQDIRQEGRVRVALLTSFGDAGHSVDAKSGERRRSLRQQTGKSFDTSI
jgi:hypothetical protein